MHLRARPDAFAPLHLLQRWRTSLSRGFGVLFLIATLLTAPAGTPAGVAQLLFALGLALVGVATVGRLWCSLYISGRKNSDLVTVGPYSLTRNPLYLFSLLGFTGVGLATETLTLGIVTGSFFAAMYVFIIRREEQELRERFGPEFDAYCSRVPRFFPRFDRYEEPGSWPVSTRLFRQTMTDVVWFVLLVALIEIVEDLHELGWVPVLWLLP